MFPDLYLILVNGCVQAGLYLSREEAQGVINEALIPSWESEDFCGRAVQIICMKDTLHTGYEITNETLNF